MGGRQRATLGGVDVVLAALEGLASCAVDVVSIRRPGVSRSGVHKACGLCEAERAGEGEPRLLYERVVCEVHGILDADQVTRVVEVDGILVAVDDEALAEATETAVAKGKVLLAAYPASQVEAATRADEACYRLRPMEKGTALSTYGLLLELASDPEVALVGMMAIRGRAKPYRLVVWRGQLVLQSLIVPSDVAEGERVEAPTNEKVVALGRQVVAESLAEFDPAALEDGRAARVAAVAEAALSGTPLPAAPAAADDMLAALEASLAAVAGKTKAPAVKRTRKKAAAA